MNKVLLNVMFNYLIHTAAMEYVSLHPTFCYDLALFDKSLGPHEADKPFKLKVHFPKWLVSLPDFQQYHCGKCTISTSFKNNFHIS